MLVSTFFLHSLCHKSNCQSPVSDVASVPPLGHEAAHCADVAIFVRDAKTEKREVSMQRRHSILQSAGDLLLSSNVRTSQQVLLRVAVRQGKSRYH